MFQVSHCIQYQIYQLHREVKWVFKALELFSDTRVQICLAAAFPPSWNQSRALHRWKTVAWGRKNLVPWLFFSFCQTLFHIRACFVEKMVNAAPRPRRGRCKALRRVRDTGLSACLVACPALARPPPPRTEHTLIIYVWLFLCIVKKSFHRIIFQDRFLVLCQASFRSHWGPPRTAFRWSGGVAILFVSFRFFHFSIRSFLFVSVSRSQSPSYSPWRLFRCVVYGSFYLCIF